MTDVTAGLEASEISSLTDGQDKVLSILPFLPACLSIMGSTTILYLVIKEKKRTTYRRLLFAMSFCDIIFSVTFPLQAFLVPQSTSQRVWAQGSDATCTALGFFQQLGFSALWYNGFLSYFFLLTVRFGWKEEPFAKWIEPWMHGIAIGFPLLTASVGAIKGYFHEIELGPGCWVSDYPDGCNLPDSDFECTSATIAWIVGGSAIIFIVFSLTFNNVSLYMHVRRTIKTGQRRSSVQIIERRTMNHSVSTAASPSTRATQMDAQDQRVRAVATQAFLYVGAFVLSYIWTFVLRIMESLSFDAEDESTLFPVLVVQALFVPIQGFFNLLIFVRPRYSRVRVAFPMESKWWCFRRALFGEDVRPVSTARRDPGSSLNTPYTMGSKKLSPQPAGQANGMKETAPPVRAVGTNRMLPISTLGEEEELNAE